MAYASRVIRLLSLGLVGACSTAAGGGTGGAAVEAPDRFITYFREDALPYTDTLNAPVEAVWRAVPEVFKQLGYPGAAATNASDRIFMTPGMQIRGRLYEGESNSKYIDCGIAIAGQRADSHEVQFVIITRVLAGSESETIVATVIDGTARDRTGTSAPRRCTGTGVLEKAITELLTAKTRG